MLSLIRWFEVDEAALIGLDSILKAMEKVQLIWDIENYSDPKQIITRDDHLPLIDFTYNNSNHSSNQIDLFKALYER